MKLLFKTDKESEKYHFFKNASNLYITQKIHGYETLIETVVEKYLKLGYERESILINNSFHNIQLQRHSSYGWSPTYFTIETNITILPFHFSESHSLEVQIPLKDTLPDKEYTLAQNKLIQEFYNNIASLE